MMTVTADISPPVPAHRTVSNRLAELVGSPADRSPWRLVAAIAAAGMAVAHIPVTKAHLSQSPYIGIGFVLVTIAGLVLMQLLLTRDTRTTWIAALAVSALSLLGYLLSRTVGLPQIHDEIGNWGEPLGVMAIVFEAILLLAAITRLLTRTPPPHR